jgi:hypothetical protein
MDDALTRMAEATSEPTARESLGGLFVEALARRDFAALGDCLLVEQHVFAASGERITALDLLCSGFVTQPSAATNRQRRMPCLERQ